MPADIRFKKTLSFLDTYMTELEQRQKVLDLGVDNELAMRMRASLGLDVDNTPLGMDLDADYSVVDDYKVFTAFEIFEHLFAPFNLLDYISGGVLYASVPLNVWFSPSYWNKDDKLDRHYHEFEVRQFNALLERTGWKLQAYEVWTTPDKFRVGIRPFMRYIFPSYYIVKAVKGDGVFTATSHTYIHCYTA